MSTTRVSIGSSNLVRSDGDANGMPVAAPSPTTPTTTPIDPPAAPVAPDPATTAAPARPEPPKRAFGFNKFGRAQWMDADQAQALNTANGYDFGSDAGAGAAQGEDSRGSDSSTAPQTTPAAPTATPTTAPTELDGLRQQLAEQQRFINAMAQRMLGGQNGVQTQPTQPSVPAGPVAPDPTAFDFYDPAQVAEYHRQNNIFIHHSIQQGIEKGVQQAVGPYAPSMESAKWRGQFEALKQQHGASDPAFERKAELAAQIIVKDREANGGRTNLNLPEVYNFVNQVAAAAGATGATATTNPNPQTPTNANNATAGQAAQAAQNANRTLTADQAAQKAQQAQRFPRRGNGAVGAGNDNPFPQVKGLGNRLALNRQLGRA